MLAIEMHDGKYYLSRVNPRFASGIERKIRTLGEVKHHQWYTTQESYFEDYPQVRSLRGRRISKGDYSKLLHVLQKTSIDGWYTSFPPFCEKCEWGVCLHSNLLTLWGCCLKSHASIRDISLLTLWRCCLKQSLEVGTKLCHFVIEQVAALIREFFVGQRSWVDGNGEDVGRNTSSYT